MTEENVKMTVEEVPQLSDMSSWSNKDETQDVSETKENTIDWEKQFTNSKDFKKHLNKPLKKKVNFIKDYKKESN